MGFETYAEYDGLGLAELVRRGEVSPEELVDAAIATIERHNPTLNAVVAIMRDHALDEIKQGLSPGPFKGVPFLVKEFGMHFKGMTTAAGSRLAQGVTFDADTELMARCKRAGLVTVGTTTTPEMAVNASTEAVVYAPTRNTWNTDQSPGGTSGGAGAADAAGMLPLAHAKDGAR
ncbi:MAG: amidase family protein, partial [Pseudomonadota bacterium]